MTKQERRLKTLETELLPKTLAVHRPMAKLRNSGMMRKMPSGIVKLKTAVEKLHKISLLLGRKQETYYDDDFEDGFCDSRWNHGVPEDVKEGHFAVIAVNGEQLKRFVVPLSCLAHPRFVRLLEESAEEFGFDHRGALEVPCRPSELEGILAEGGESRDASDDGTSWGLFL